MTADFTGLRQVRRPRGRPTPDDFRFYEGTTPELETGQVLVANSYLSVDPYHREWMDEEGWEKGFGLEGRALGTVVESRDPDLPEGTVVFHRHGWATHALLSAEDRPRVVEAPEGVPLSSYLSLLGGTGMTAYVGLVRVARLQAGEDLFISSAAGGVGTAAAQIARALGARRIVGSAGSAAKVARLTGELGFDAAFNYRDGSPTELLAAAAPDGVDVFFDNVGGDHLEAGLAALRHHGRVAWCGAVAQYDDPANPPAAPRNLYDVVHKALRVEGFLVRDHLDVREEFEAFLTPRIASGEITPQETIVDGFENTVTAFLAMLNGENVGKMLVRL
ncbi:MAG: NADP-dependent oxidoreductase [Catenulispora sp.]|nr:NADP-dependent oxidoreductase [Catenulispora sp.]